VYGDQIVEVEAVGADRGVTTARLNAQDLGEKLAAFVSAFTTGLGDVLTTDLPTDGARRLTDITVSVGFTVGGDILIVKGSATASVQLRFARENGTGAGATPAL
jgi:hypothetical protein